MARRGERYTSNVRKATDDGVEQYRDVLLSAQDKRLCMGGLGRMDGRWEDSGFRMNEAFIRVSDPGLRRLNAEGGTAEGRRR